MRFLDRELKGHLDAARHHVAAFLGADPDGMVFVPNTTTGVSTVLASRRFSPGDELLACDHEYNATLNALRVAATRDGATVVIVRVPFPVTDPSQVVVLPRGGDTADAARAGQPRHVADGPRDAGRRARPRTGPSGR